MKTRLFVKDLSPVLSRCMTTLWSITAESLRNAHLLRENDTTKASQHLFLAIFYSMHVWVRGLFMGAGSLLLLCGF